MMIQLLEEWLEGLFYAPEVHEPPCFMVNFTGYFNITDKTVAVDASAFVAFRRMGKIMGSFETEGP
jgi:hypothetical protein